MNLRSLTFVSAAGAVALVLGFATAAAADRYHSYEPLPTCSIALGPVSGEGYQKTAMLTWSSTNAEHGNLHGFGSVGQYGARAVVYPFKDRYTLTVEGPGGKVVCDTEYAYHSGSIYYKGHIEKYVPVKPVPYVTLTQIPYTGFDIGLAAYFAMMALVALAGGYLLTYYNGGVFRKAFVREVAHAARNQARVARRVMGL